MEAIPPRLVEGLEIPLGRFKGAAGLGRTASIAST
jgi:hypothetical protein